jgi:hypothetical protein
MLGSIIRSASAVIFGLVAALLLVIAVEGFSAIVYPFPEGFNGTPAEMMEHVAAYPNRVLAVVVPMWGSTVFFSSWLATRLGANRHPAHGYGIGILLFVAVIFNMYMLPYPLWFEISNLLSFSLAIYWGVRLGRTQ